MTQRPIATEALTKRSATVHGKTMSYHDSGEGEAILFLHGNPTSSYLWRNVIPHLQAHGRCIAPDLIGMGESEKLDMSEADAYRFISHRRYLDGLLDQLDLGDKVTLVLHDWGSALGFDWANRHRERVSAIAYMEAIVAPITSESLDPNIARAFQGFRSPAGESMILEKNFFIERMLPSAVARGLSEDEMAVYRKPFLTPDSRQPTLVWPRELPLDGAPQDVCAIVQSYGEWLSQSQIPKLFINAEPGSMLVGAHRAFCRSWPAQEEVSVKGVHFIQEDSPHEIGEAIASWLKGQ